MHAAHALSALREQGVNVNSFGMGANKLSEQGMELLLDCRELAVIGIVDVLINYPKFLKRLKLLREALEARKPDLLVIVDYPDFNLKLAATAKALNIPVLFYISPQVWAWRKKRVTMIGQRISHMAVLFPFEVEVYQEANIPVSYVGHPLVDDAKSSYTQTEAQLHFNLDVDKPTVALLPGSRIGELKRNLPAMLETANMIANSITNCQFLIPIAPTLTRAEVESICEPFKQLKTATPIQLVESSAYDVMRAADCALCASGTATLETAMLGTPMAIMYRINKLNYFIMKRLIQIDNIGLVNIVADKRIVQEFIQDAAQPHAMAEEIIRLLQDTSYTATMRNELVKVQEKMGSGGASQNVATLIAQLVK